MTGLGPVAKSPLSGLSRGVLRRVSIARSLIHRPKMLILDGPFDGLDDAARRLVCDTLRVVRREGMTVVGTVTSSSDLEPDGMRIWDRVEVLKGGELRPWTP
jgi:ABC-type multidrug transport system ATPase subunit